MVYLVGAGPGDPGLITVRALELLRAADVVLYDRLAADILLLETRPGCELVDVGKSAGDHTMRQEDISALLVAKGKAGSTVVRLKGGDPFLFGRGGEEAEALVDAGIPFEVVPGVSALIAATAYAGIPVTHRSHASSVGVATGHGAGDKDHDPVRWRKLAAGVDTVVVFMGVGALETITAELTAGGMDPDTPAAVVERGCTPRQRTITGTLAGIATTARREGVQPPALLVVSPSVALADTIGWYRPGPLAGLRIGVTRPLKQSQSFAERLARLGAVPVPMPTIETVATVDTPEVAAAMDRLAAYDLIAFSSTNGVEAFFEAHGKRKMDTRALAGKWLAAIGPATADALAARGIRADIAAETFVAEGLLAAITETFDAAGKRILLVRSDIGRRTLGDGLRGEGAKVDEAAFYATRRAELRPYALDIVCRGDIDMVTFTSSSTVDGFFGQIAPEEVPPQVRYASIGPETSKALRRYGVTAHIEAAEYTTAGLAEAILSTCGAKPGMTEKNK